MTKLAGFYAWMIGNITMYREEFLEWLLTLMKVWRMKLLLLIQ
jgi:hypothetical protein